MSLTVAYISCRKDNRFAEWFLPSLKAQCGDDSPRIIYVDFYCDEARWKETRLKALNLGWDGEIEHCPPKPTVWQGPHRLTKEDWFAAANQRNTALCLCETSHIVYCDDLSVLLPGWYQAVKEACERENTVTCGAYKKVRELTVENGIITHCIETPSGTDNRLSIAQKAVCECTGEWLYGCSLVAPVDLLMSVDGWPESICDGMGFEDCLMGIVLQNRGTKFVYDKRMMTYESDEMHGVEPAFRREDYGKSPDDKSHRALNIAKQSKTFDNGFGDGGIKEYAKLVHDVWGTFPPKGTPQHEWFTSKPLSEL